MPPEHISFRIFGIVSGQAEGRYAIRALVVIALAIVAAYVFSASGRP